MTPKKVKFLLVNFLVLGLFFYILSEDIIGENSEDTLEQKENEDNNTKTNIRLGEVTLVTSYYKIPSKHEHTQFLDWMKGLLITTDNLVIYTEEAMLPVLEELSAGNRHPGNTIYRIEDIKESMVAKRYSREDWDNQKDFDREAQLHKSVDVYWVWNNKAEQVRKVAEENPFNSEYFFWVDIGYLRTSGGKYNGTNWFRRNQFFDSCVLTLVVKNFIGKDLQLNSEGESDVDFNNPKWRLAGGIWGGTSNAVNRWHKFYYQMLDRYLTEGRFAGNDQAVMSTTCMETPDLCCMISPPPDFWNSWFWFDPYLANRVDSPIYNFVRP